MAIPKVPSKISDIFKGYNPQTALAPFLNPLSQNFTPPVNPIGPVPTTAITRTLPVSGETYQSPVISQPTVPVAPKVAPVVTSPQSPTGAVGLDYSKYTDPTTGKVLSPQEYANMLAQRVSGGSVPNYVGNALTQGPQTTPQLMSTATDLNNERNDIAVGATDPYGAASKSGIAYSPTEMTAIEKAYAGIYDPALKDVFSKLDKKQKDDAAALDLKNQLALQAQKHKDDISLKQTPTSAEASASALSASGQGPYVPGANPIVDAWAQRIYDGTSKITDIPASDKGMRNAVTVALNANGNQANGKPTTSALGVQALSTAQDLLDKFDSGKGTSAVGASRIFGYGSYPPPGSDAANLVNDFNTLKSQLSLDAVKYLKGQGAVSDAERALLASAVTKLNLTQSDGKDGDFRKTLQGIIDTLKGGQVNDSGFNVTDPDGGVHTFPTQAAANEFKNAIGQ